MSLEGLNRRGDGSNWGKGDGSSFKQPVNYLFGEGYKRHYVDSPKPYPLNAVDLLVRLAAREAVTRA